MTDAKRAVTKLQEDYGPVIASVTTVNGIPVVRLKRDDLPTVAHYVHTQPAIRGSLSLLWAVAQRPTEAGHEIWHLFTLAERRDWLLLVTELPDGERSSIPSRRISMPPSGMSGKFATCSG
jgi:hypothetical protein